MARGKKPILDKNKILLAAGVAALIALGALIFSLGSQGQFSSLSEFPVDRYLDNKGLFSQEDFRIQGTVDNVLLRANGGGHFLVSIRPDESQLLLPVLMEPGKKPLQRDQRLLLRVHVASNGGIVCTDYIVR